MKKTKPKIKHLKVSTEKARAWKAFSEYMRRKNINPELGGLVECYTCNNLYEWKNIQAGHGIPGRNNAILFLEAIVKPQCAGCNIWHRGNYAVFTRRLIDELGLEEYDKLSNLSQQVVKFTPLDFRDRYEYYKAKCEELK